MNARPTPREAPAASHPKPSPARRLMGKVAGAFSGGAAARPLGLSGRRQLGRILIMNNNAINQTGSHLEIVSLPPGRPGVLHRHHGDPRNPRLGAGDPDAAHAAYVLGLINLRGAVIPVIDMACRLGMKMTEPSERSAIIVTDIAGKLVGLLVEQVSDMMTIKSEDLQPAPEIIPEAQRAFCRGIVALEKTDGLLPQPRHRHRRRAGKQAA